MINGFALFIGMGAVFGLMRVLQDCPPATRMRHLLAALTLLMGALLGAKAGFVIAYHAYFVSHPHEILRLASGGLSWPGALAGAILFAWIGLKISGLAILAGFDRFSRMLMPMGVFVWLAAWISGTASGELLPAGTWWGMWIADESGFSALRVPVQPAAAISLMLILLLCERLIRQVSKKGLRGAWLGFAFSIHALLFSFMRYDSVQRWFGLRWDSWAAMFWLAFFAVLILALSAGRKNKQAPEME